MMGTWSLRLLAGMALLVLLSGSARAAESTPGSPAQTPPASAEPVQTWMVATTDGELYLGSVTRNALAAGTLTITTRSGVPVVIPQRQVSIEILDRFVNGVAPGDLVAKLCPGSGYASPPVREVTLTGRAPLRAQIVAIVPGHSLRVVKLQSLSAEPEDLPWAALEQVKHPADVFEHDPCRRLRADGSVAPETPAAGRPPESGQPQPTATPQIWTVGNLDGEFFRGSVTHDSPAAGSLTITTRTGGQVSALQRNVSVETPDSKVSEIEPEQLVATLCPSSGYASPPVRKLTLRGQAPFRAEVHAVAPGRHLRVRPLPSRSPELQDLPWTELERVEHPADVIDQCRSGRTAGSVAPAPPAVVPGSAQAAELAAKSRVAALPLPAGAPQTRMVVTFDGELYRGSVEHDKPEAGALTIKTKGGSEISFPRRKVSIELLERPWIGSATRHLVKKLCPVDHLPPPVRELTLTGQASFRAAIYGIDPGHYIRVLPPPRISNQLIDLPWTDLEQVKHPADVHDPCRLLLLDDLAAPGPSATGQARELQATDREGLRRLPIEPAQTTRRRWGRTLVGVGFGVFGATYLMHVLVATATNSPGQYSVPLLGPFLSLGHSGWLDYPVALSGLGQVGALVTAAVGLRFWTHD